MTNKKQATTKAGPCEMPNQKRATAKTSNGKSKDNGKNKDNSKGLLAWVVYG